MTSTEHAGPPLRPTRQRLAVVEALATFDDFRSAQEIHELIGSSGGNVGLATVYRTLQKLSDAGEVDMLRTEDGEAIIPYRGSHVNRRCERDGRHRLRLSGVEHFRRVDGPPADDARSDETCVFRCCGLDNTAS